MEAQPHRSSRDRKAVSCSHMHERVATCLRRQVSDQIGEKDKNEKDDKALVARWDVLMQMHTVLILASLAS